MTFPIGQDMVDLGYKMISAQVDESGYFLIVQYENTKLNHFRSTFTGIPICKENTITLVKQDLVNKERPCQKCLRLMQERRSTDT